MLAIKVLGEAEVLLHAFLALVLEYEWWASRPGRFTQYITKDSYLSFYNVIFANISAKNSNSVSILLL